MRSEQVFRRFFVVCGETRELCKQFSEERLAAHQLRQEYAKMIGGVSVWGTDRKIVGIEWPDGKTIPGEWKKRDELFDTPRIIVPDIRTKKGREIAEHFETFAVVPDASEFTQRIGRSGVVAGNVLHYASYEYCGGLCVVQIPCEKPEHDAVFADAIEIPAWLYALLKGHASKRDSGDSWKSVVADAEAALRSLVHALTYDTTLARQDVVEQSTEGTECQTPPESA